MTIRSYAQNFEDVLLWRALRDIGSGFYIDIGAQHPVIDSVSNGFYERGWRGISIEPSAQYAHLLREARPDEQVIQAAVAANSGVARFFQIADTGLSTCVEAIAEAHAVSGWHAESIAVPTMTLDAVFSIAQREVVHWLKIDVEGLETQVLEGWRDSLVRPWIVLVEVLSPLGAANLPIAWEHLLLDKGYELAHFDGLNHFYVSETKSVLKAHFGHGPSLWDGFQLTAESRNARELVAQFNTEAAAQADALTLAHRQIRELRQEKEVARIDAGRHESDLAIAQVKLSAIRAERRRLFGDLELTHASWRQTRRLLDAALIDVRQAHDQLSRCEVDARLSTALARRHRVHLVALIEAITASRWWRLSAPFRRTPSLLALVAAEYVTDTDNVDAPLGAGTLQELLDYNGEAFVRCAYATLLGRGPDPEGLRHYLGRLALDSSRERIVASMCMSPEGLRFAAKLPGLDALVAHYRLHNKPVLGALMRSTGIWSSPRRAFWFLPSAPRLGPVNGRVASSVAELLSLRGEPFIRSVYLTLLARDPDPDELARDLKRLSHGENPMSLLIVIRRSREGRQRRPNLTGLAHAIRCYRWRHIPLLGTLLRLFGSCPSEPRIQDRIAAIQTQLTTLQNEGISNVIDEAAEISSNASNTPSAAQSVLIGQPSEDATGLDEIMWAPRLNWVLIPAGEQTPLEKAMQVELGLALEEVGQVVSNETAGDVDEVRVRVGSPPIFNTDGDEILFAHDLETNGYPEVWVHQMNSSLRGVASASQHMSKILIDHGLRINLATVGIGIDHILRVEHDRIYRAPGKRFRFLHVSACNHAKGVDLLLESFGRVFTADDDVSLIVKATASVPPEFINHLQRLRESNSSFPEVLLVEGALSDAEMRSLYEQCHVFVAPSRAEGFGLTIASALLFGLPVIATNWGGHLDYCDAASSWLLDYRFYDAVIDLCQSAYAGVEPLDDELDQALSRAYRTSAVQRANMVAIGRKRLLEKFSWRRVAQRLSLFANKNSLPANETNPSEIQRVGCVTTWNVKCGIASYASHLLASIAAENVHVFAGRQEPQIAEDKHNCVRCWTPSKDKNDLSEALQQIEAELIDAIVIHFNYGFFNHAELGEFIDALVDRGVLVFVDFHSTKDPNGGLANYRIADFANALKRCHRLLSHSTADLNRLKALGLVENVMLMPLGVPKREKPRLLSNRTDNMPLITSFGFCFSNKGLVELIEATSFLQRAGRPVRLRMLNAVHPSPDSASEARRIVAAIDRLGLGNLIETNFQFLDDELCMTLISQADLLVNSYQHTSESASAAVRYGLAARCPVAVTPLAIFDDLGDAVFRLPGIKPSEIADGIAQALDDLAVEGSTARHVKASAERWLCTHDFALQGNRLMAMFGGIKGREQAQAAFAQH